MRTRVICSLLIAYTLGQLYFHLGPLLGYRPAPAMTSLVTLAFFAFSVSHARLRLGLLHTGVFVLVTFAISLLAETIGVLTGVIYGPYYYTDKLTPKIFDLVPALMPLAWFMMIYASYDLVRIIVGDLSAYSVRRSAGLGGALVWTLALSGISALAVSAWDLVLDPQMVAEGYWVWTNAGAYFGIPVHNFAGWLATTFTIYLVYGLFELRVPAQPDPRLEQDQLFAHLPALSYAITGLSGSISGLQRGQPALLVIGFFSMGGLVMLAAAKLWYRIVIRPSWSASD